MIRKKAMRKTDHDSARAEGGAAVSRFFDNSKKEIPGVNDAVLTWELGLPRSRAENIEAIGAGSVENPLSPTGVNPASPEAMRFVSPWAGSTPTAALGTPPRAGGREIDIRDRSAIPFMSNPGDARSRCIPPLQIGRQEGMTSKEARSPAIKLNPRSLGGRDGWMGEAIILKNV